MYLETILLLRKKGGEVHSVDVAAWLGYAKSSVSRGVNLLREKGYIRAECCSSDDRRKILFATEKAEQIENFLEETIRTTQGRMYGCFSKSELITPFERSVHHIEED